jgi:hypothetical protein
MTLKISFWNPDVANAKKRMIERMLATALMCAPC